MRATAVRHVLPGFDPYVLPDAPPAVGGKRQIVYFAGDALDRAFDDEDLLEALYGFAAGTHGTPSLSASFVAVFQEPRRIDDAAFESLVQERLERLVALDHKRHQWTTGMSPIFDDGRYRFVLGGAPFVAVGLHPNSRQRCRRSALPMLVLHVLWPLEPVRPEPAKPKLSLV
jgi:FPC/CPF motif-containing protein YcgG